MSNNPDVPNTSQLDDDDDLPQGFGMPKADADTEEETDNVPDGFGADDDDDDESNHVESLAGFKINSERDATEREMLSAPTGDYAKRSRQPWQYRVDTIVTDKAKGDFSKKGRLFIAFTGPVENHEWKGSISFRLSPDKRHAVDYTTKKVDPTRIDQMYRLWLQAEEYYILQTGEEPSSVLDVIDLLSKDDEIVFRVVKGRDIGSGSFVMGFKKQV